VRELIFPRPLLTFALPLALPRLIFSATGSALRNQHACHRAGDRPGEAEDTDYEGNPQRSTGHTSEG
jgi:hypothetical protein